MGESKTKECIICLEDVPTNKLCCCGFCEYNACIGCTKKSILYQTSDPTCPSCNHAWSMEFCYKNFSKTWMTKSYRDHKKQLLFEIEKSKIPNTMPAVERIIKIERVENKRKEILSIIKSLEEEIWKARCELSNCNEEARIIKYSKIKKEEVYNFKCPKEDCAGFLNNKFVCPMCNSHVCKKCFEIKEIDNAGESKSDKVKYNHTCKDESIESFKLIKKETKPCPKCSSRIFKISGCDQMWCTLCHTTFSWTTGLEVNGNIHNPHYYEWKKTNAETADFRNVGEVLCGGIPDLNILNSISRNLKIYKTNLLAPSNVTSWTTQFYKYNSNYMYKNVPAEILYCKSTSCFIPIFEGTLFQSLKNILKNSNSLLAKHFNSSDFNSLNDKNKRMYASLTRQDYFLDNLLRLHRALTHFSDYELHYLRIAVRDIDLKDEGMRIKYIMNKYNEKHYKMLIMKKNTKKQKLTKILHIFEMCNVTILETYNDIIKCVLDIINEYNNHCDIIFDQNFNDAQKEIYFQDEYLPWFKNNIDVKKPNIIKNYDRINNILNYCNKELWKVSKLFNQNVPFIHYGPYFSCDNGVKYFDRPGYLQTISAKWDSNIFQLWKKEEDLNKNKRIKVRGEEQEKHFNSCWLFNNDNNYTLYEERDAMGRVLSYKKLVGIKDIFGCDEKNKVNDMEKKHDCYGIIRYYGRGSSLFS